jgi:hypothetical protein
MMRVTTAVLVAMLAVVVTSAAPAVTQVKNLLASCGDDTTLAVLPGADHVATLGTLRAAGHATTIVRSLERHRRR